MQLRNAKATKTSNLVSRYKHWYQRFQEYKSFKVQYKIDSTRNLLLEIMEEIQRRGALHLIPTEGVKEDM